MVTKILFVDSTTRPWQQTANSTWKTLFKHQLMFDQERRILLNLFWFLQPSLQLGKRQDCPITIKSTVERIQTANQLRQTIAERSDTHWQLWLLHRITFYQHTAFRKYFICKPNFTTAITDGFKRIILRKTSLQFHSYRRNEEWWRNVHDVTLTSPTSANCWIIVSLTRTFSHGI